MASSSSSTLTPRHEPPSQSIPQSVSISPAPISKIAHGPSDDVFIIVSDEHIHVARGQAQRTVSPPGASSGSEYSDSDTATVEVDLSSPMPAPVPAMIVSSTPPPWTPPATATLPPLLHRTETLPPPYLYPLQSRVSDVEEALPNYSAPQEGSTLARYLFFFGFMCPIFWLVGGAIMFMELKPVDGLESSMGRSTIERDQKLGLLRKTEVKWSKRCWWALGMTLLVVGILIIVLRMASVI